MESIKEFFDAIRGQLAERLANPFTGAFVIAWVIWNFRLLIVFAGKGTYQEKFTYIDGNLYLDWRYWLLRGLVVPVITAAAYLWAYPRATRWLAEDYRRQQTKANNLMKAAEGTALLSVEESRALRLRFAEAEQQWETERSQLIKELDAQREMVADLLRRREELMRQSANLQAAISSSTIVGGLNLPSSKSKNGAATNNTDVDRKQFKLTLSDAKNLRTEVGNEPYTRGQLQVLSILREGNTLPIEDLVGRMKAERFNVQRMLDRLYALDLVDTVNEQEWFITEDGRALLGAFVDSNHWNFAAEGV